MPKYNRSFTLTLEDIDLIEAALRAAKNAPEADARKLADLLGRLHNQKIFYRPEGTYVSG